jgi:two-component system, NarL family, nitrate/nitrite response regulator NarL
MNDNDLTPREQQVASLIAAGHSNATIAYLLDISQHTVKTHVGRAFDKLGVDNRVQLALRVHGITPSTRLRK